MEIGKLGERKLIEMIRDTYSYAWPDSDSAYIDVGKKRILITNDSITKSTHMPSGAGPEHIGYFFAAINLSDIAAMGGTPQVLHVIANTSVQSGFWIRCGSGARDKEVPQSLQCEDDWRGHKEREGTRPDRDSDR